MGARRAAPTVMLGCIIVPHDTMARIDEETGSIWLARTTS